MHGAGACIRLELEDFTRPASMPAALAGLLAAIGTTPGNTDLILDLKGRSADELVSMTLLVPTLIASIPSVTQWRTLTLAATGFPSDLTQIPTASDSKILRTEWGIWLSLRATQGDLPRLPTFGDYAISHPVPTEVDPRLMRMSANLRYTTDVEWLILKGRNVRDHGYDQFNGHCRTLLQRPEYNGPSFSWGDEYIFHCSEGVEGPGNATKWRQAGTSHHLTFVVWQIANLGAI